MENTRNAAGRGQVAQVVTDCCGRRLPDRLTLTGDVHFPDLCPACRWLARREHSSYVTGVVEDRPEHASHVTCDDGHCPGREGTEGAATTAP